VGAPPEGCAQRKCVARAAGTAQCVAHYPFSILRPGQEGVHRTETSKWLGTPPKLSPLNNPSRPDLGITQSGGLY
jgi:hypothetical protein